MDARVSYILSQVRLQLGKVGVQDIQNAEIYAKANVIVRRLLREYKPVEKTFSITLVADQEAYDFSAENALTIINMFPSWYETGQLIEKSNKEWKDIAVEGSDNPLYYTIFNKQIYLRPIPQIDDEYIIVWAHQTDVLNPVDENTPPDTPADLDDIIVEGICSKYDEKFEDRYERALLKIPNHFHAKTLSSKERSSNW